MKKNKIFNFIMIGIICLTSVLFIFSFFHPFLSPVEKVDFGDALTIGVVNKNTVLSQKFRSEFDTLDAILIQCATYNHENENGKMIIEIYDPEQTKIYYNEYDLEEITDNSSLKLEFDVQKKTKGKEYTLVIHIKELTKDEILTFYAMPDEDSKVETTTKLDVDNSIKVYQYGETQTYFYTIILFALLLLEIFIFSIKKFKNKKLNEKKNYQKMLLLILYIGISLIFSASLIDVGMDLYYENRLSIITFPILVVSSIIIIVVLVRFISQEKLKVENLFVILAIPISCMYLLSLIPGNIPDEPYHYKIAYQVSKGNILLKDRIEYKESNKIYSNYKAAREKLFDQTKDSRETYKEQDGGYSPLLYIFSSLGVLIGRIFHLTFLGTKYLGSFFNLLLFIVTGYFIIKLLPYGKYLGLVYLLNPMNIQQMTSLSCDAVINANSLLFIAYILHLNHSGEKLNIKNIILLCIFTIIILVSKRAYIPLLLLLFLLKNNMKKTEKKDKKLLIVLLITVITLVFGISSFVRNSYSNPITNPNKKIVQLESKQPQTKYTKLQYTLTSPTKPIFVILNTIYNYIDYYIYSFAGRFLGALNILMPTYIITLYIIILIISVYFDSEKNKLNKKEKIILLMGSLFSFGLVLMGLYLYCGNLRDLVTVGAQGRYFIPIFIIPLLLLQSKKIKFDIERKNLILSSFLLFINIYIVLEVMKYYLN